MARKLFDERLSEPISPLIDVVVNGLAAIFIILMIYVVVVQPNQVERLRFLRGVQPPPAYAGRGYVFTFPVAGGVGERRFRLAGGTPPAGLALDSLTGTLYGTPPSAPGALRLRVEVRDSAGGMDTLSATVQVGAAAVPYSPEAAPLAIIRRTAALPAARAGVPYEQVLGAVGGVEPYTWRLAAGALPPGLALEDGRLAGTPRRAGRYRFQVELAHSAARFVDGTRAVAWWGGVQRRAFELNVVPAEVRHVLHLPTGRVGEPYLGFVVLRGAPDEAVAWTAAVPGLAAGADGTLAGTPSRPGTFAVSYRVGTDGAVAGSGSLRVLPPLPSAALGPVTVSARVGDTVRIAVPYRGLREPVMLRLMGTLPEGLALADGEVAGIPRRAGSAAVAIEATDAVGAAVRGTVYVRVAVRPAPLAMDSVTVVTMVAGQRVHHRLRAAGGEGARAWSAGALPPGLRLAGDAVAGVVTAPGTWRTPVTVREAGTGRTASGTLVLRAVHAEESRPRLLTTGAPTALAGEPYEFVPAVEGGVGAARVELRGALPAGLRWNGTAIAGVPVHPGSAASITLAAVDQAGQRTEARRLRLVVERVPRGAPRVATTALPPAVPGAAYAQTFAAEGGSGAYTWELRGSLPPGLRFTRNGIGGRLDARASGAWTITARVRDDRGRASAPVTLRLAAAALPVRGWPALAIDPAPLPVAWTDVPYAAVLLAHGCGGRCTWSAEHLPPGLRIRDGRIEGTVRRPGTYRLAVTAADPLGRRARGQLVLEVKRPPRRWIFSRYR